MITKAWKVADQENFARLSGDFNPSHMDRVGGRRSLFGKAVVHGVHVLIWALNELFLKNRCRGMLSSIRVVFRKPLGVGDIGELSFKKETSGLMQATVICRGTVCVEISVEVVAQSRADSISSVRSVSFSSAHPKDWGTTDLKGINGFLEISGDLQALQQHYPEVCAAVPWNQLAFLLTTSRLIGMECPGLYSIYSELSLSFDRENICEGSVAYEVIDYRTTFHLARIRLLSSSAKGEIKAFVRPVLCKGNLLEVLNANVNAEEFRGQRALIVGGVRGLGEIAAKALVLGGADVIATYVQGKKEAAVMEKELELSSGVFQTTYFDARDFDQDVLSILPSGWRPTHLYYFATPFIFDGAKKRFSEKIFNNFVEMYVGGFWRVFERLFSLGALRFALYPSSSALVELPGDMFEYVVAKAAGEKMCEYIRNFFKGITLLCPRLERLATDQTVSLKPVDNKDPVPVVLDLLRHSNGSK